MHRNLTVQDPLADIEFELNRTMLKVQHGSMEQTVTPNNMRLDARLHEIEVEAERARAPRVAARDLAVVVVRRVLKVLGADRALVDRRHAAEVAEAERAAVRLEPLHEDRVVVRLQPRVGRPPLGAAPRAEDARAHAILVRARQRLRLRRRRRVVLDDLGRRQRVEGADELLERARRAVVLAAELHEALHDPFAG